MTIATHGPDADVETLPDDLASPRAKLVYLYLATTDGGTVGEIQASLGLPKLTLFSVLDALTGRGLVERRGDAYVPAA